MLQTRLILYRKAFPMRSMTRLRWALLGCVALLAIGGGVGAWAYAQRTYPNAVYYLQSTVTWSNSGPSHFEYWTDPLGQFVAGHNVDTGAPSVQYLIDIRANRSF